jgi:hypothetical protein
VQNVHVSDQPAHSFHLAMHADRHLRHPTIFDRFAEAASDHVSHAAFFIA